MNSAFGLEYIDTSQFDVGPATTAQMFAVLTNVGAVGVIADFGATTHGTSVSLDNISDHPAGAPGHRRRWGHEHR